MKNTFFAFIIISIFSTGIVSAQNTVVAAAQKLPANPVSTNIEPPKGYMLGPGDEISGSVLLEPQFNFIATVNEDGRIEVPFFETPIMAKCKTEKELRTDITALLSKYLRNPQLSLRTEKKSRPKTTVYGEVRNPAQIELTRRATLIELIAAAGGITEDAGGVIQVFRTQPPLCSDASDENNWKAETGDATEVPSRIYSLAAVRLGREESNPVILPGDVIHVQKAAPAYITGEVVAPQGILLKEGGTSLSEAIAKISGTTRTAKTKEIKIYRLKPGANPASKEREILVANLELIRTGKQKDILLQPYDIVEVDKTKKSLALTILEFAVGAGKQAIQSAANTSGARIIY